MNIVVLSNFFNHHQKPISDALYQELGKDYHFIETVPLPEERKQLGYSMEDKPEYVCSAYQSEENLHRCRTLLDAADVVITGSAPEKLVQRCIRQKKLVLRYGERQLKNGLEPLKFLPRLLLWNVRNPKTKPIFQLCASGYAAADYRKFGMFRKKTYKWGYFPETRRYADLPGMLNAKSRRKILWCGRFLDWKHPEHAIFVAKRMKREGYGFEMIFIGTGDQEETLRKMTKAYGLEKQVRFLGSMLPEQVRTHMEEAGIFLFTSDRREGWGAVLNEAMNSGCAVVASHAIGAVPFLLENGKNGLLYRSGDVDRFYRCVKWLLEHPEEQIRLGKAAYITITEEWNAELAAGRVKQLAQALLSGEKEPELFESGPCSKAVTLRENWFTETELPQGLPDRHRK